MIGCRESTSYRNAGHVVSCTKTRRMDSPKDHPHRLENFQAWQLARQLATRAYQATLKPAFKDHDWLAESIRCNALEAPTNLARGYESPRGCFERGFHYQRAKIECARLQSLLAIASDLGLINAADGSKLHESCEGTRRMIGAVLKATQRAEENAGEAERDAPPSFRPSSRGPSRRPPASGGGFHGDDPWDTRS